VQKETREKGGSIVSRYFGLVDRLRRCGNTSSSRQNFAECTIKRLTLTQQQACPGKTCLELPVQNLLLVVCAPQGTYYRSKLFHQQQGDYKLWKKMKTRLPSVVSESLETDLLKQKYVLHHHLDGTIDVVHWLSVTES